MKRLFLLLVFTTLYLFSCVAQQTIQVQHLRTMNEGGLIQTHIYNVGIDYLFTPVEIQTYDFYTPLLITPNSLTTPINITPCNNNTVYPSESGLPIPMSRSNVELINMFKIPNNER